MLKILILVSSINTGDFAQSEAISKAFISTHKAEYCHKIEASNNYDEAKNRFIEELGLIPSQEKYIILAIGEEGMKLLSTLEKERLIDYQRSYVILSIHQFFKEIKNLKLNQIVIPESTINNTFEQEVIKKIPEVTYVFAPVNTNPSEEDLEKSYEAMINKPDLNKNYIVVMLPGDAPDGNNQIKFFTKNSAKSLFQCVRNLWLNLDKKYKILLENGPRTGKYDPETGSIASLHEYKTGENPAKAIDNISKYFMSLLDENKIEYDFFNFAVEIREDKRETISYFKPLLYVARQQNNIFVIPGASTSIIGQVPLYLYSDRIILFRPSSMNEDHENVVKTAFQKNYISYFDNNCEVVHPKEITKRDQDDLEIVIKNIYQGFLEYTE